MVSINYQLDIREHNKQAHIDIEDEIKAKKDGLFTFTLRVNNQNIADCVIMQYSDSRDYLALRSIVIQELTVTHDNRERGKDYPIRNDNLQHNATSGSSGLNKPEHSETKA